MDKDNNQSKNTGIQSSAPFIIEKIISKEDILAIIEKSKEFTTPYHNDLDAIEKTSFIDLNEKINFEQDFGSSKNKNADQGEGDKESEKSSNGEETKSKHMPLGERLISKGLLSKDQLEVALKEQKEQKEHRKMLGAILVELGFITESALGEVLTESSGVENFSLHTAVIDQRLVRQVPKEISLKCKAVPVSINDNIVQVAMSDVYNILALDQIRKFFPKDIKLVPVYSSEGDINDIIDQYYEYEMSVDGILKEIETGSVDDSKMNTNIDGYINPTVRLVDALLIDAIKKGASDIHFEPEGAFVRLRYRIDGNLAQIRAFHKDYWPTIAVRLKIMSGMNIAETRNPQDGRISYNILGRVIDFRVATHPTVHGENIVIRILDKRKSLLPLDKLGFSNHNIKLLKKLLKRPEGIIIVTGPTGSGKTTTLYSILNYINKIDVNIMTLEDPVEYQLSLIRQSNIKEGSGMDFLSGIKSLLRQDPDIIFLGEIRDKETSTMAVRAAMTGHQVYTSLHTNDALGAIPRLIDIGVQPQMLSGSIICIVAQRLTRVLCSHCKKKKIATLEECKVLGVDPKSPPEIYERQGCEHCEFRGYRGRVAINEVLPLDSELDDLIAQNATRKVMMDYLMSHGYVPMVNDGIRKILEGVTDLDEIMSNINITDRL